MNEANRAIRYEGVSDLLPEHLPELREAYEAELEWWGCALPGPHVIYGDVLSPHIDRLLQDADETSLRRVFEFLELLSCSQDVRVQEVVAVTICEHIGDDAQRLAQARRFMGPATLKISDENERFWNE